MTPVRDFKEAEMEAQISEKKKGPERRTRAPLDVRNNTRGAFIERARKRSHCLTRSVPRKFLESGRRLPLFGGFQLAVDTTIVFALHCDGTARRGAANQDGVALEQVRRHKERTYPEIVQPSHCGSEVGDGGKRSCKTLVRGSCFVHPPTGESQGEE